MNRGVFLLMLFLCFAHHGLGQTAKRQAPPASELALEFLSASGGFPSYLEIPAPNGSAGIGSGPGSSELETQRKGVRISVTQELPGTLRIRLWIADNLDSEGRAGPDDKSWREAGDYALPITENETLTLPNLEEYGFFQLRIVPAKLPASSSLRVDTAFNSLQVVRIEQVIRDWHKVFLRNVSDRPIFALYGRFSANDLTGHNSLAEPLIAAGETKEFRYSPPSQGEKIGDQLVPIGNPEPELRYVAVYYGDGGCEGEQSVCARITAEREANRLAATLETALLEQALADPDPERFLRQAPDSKQHVSPEAVKRVVEETLTRFPDATPSLVLTLEQTVQNTLRDYGRYYGSVLDGLGSRDPNSATPDVRKLIRDRLRQQQLVAAMP